MKKRFYLIVLLIITITFFSGITYSLFTSDAKMSSSNQEIASFLFEEQDLDKINLNLKDMVPGVNSQYDFSVKNSKNDKVSDVTIEYQITIKTYHFIPLEINLYQIVNNEEVYIGTCDETYTRNEDNELVCNMPIKEMVKSTNTMDNYRLRLNFSSEYSDIKYSDLVDFINIEINSWQKI